jgi:mono/diheme cytochrome c family protein
MNLFGAMVCVAAVAGPANAADAWTFSTQPAASGQPLNPAGEGRRLFLKLNCYSCHGMGAAGAMGPNIVHAEKGDLNEVLRGGEDGGMPSYRQYVNSRDVDNLAAYLKSIGTQNEPTFNDWWVKIPPK